ncbi:maestro heat-like repeat family member 5 [Pithys albifrons albifrons]|uniref:maestro heat-like repeat family member 5 n=1 Tax=Pithys albifrons albifrons TaxID=3385563 RepID=UPI003A5CB355
MLSLLLQSPSRQAELEQSGHEPDGERHQGCPSVVTANLLLGGLVGLSEAWVRNIEVFLPGMMKILQDGREDVKMKILVVLGNVLGQLQKRKASSIAVQLVARLLPLFDSECSELREISICMFTHLLELVVWRDEKRMRKEVQRALVPLLFRMSDQTPSVAEASREALLGVSELLRWKTLQHLLKRERLWELGACLLKKSRSRTEEYLQQSLPYLQDPQNDVRLAAVRFITLQPLETDQDMSVRSLAAQTTLFLRSRPMQPRSRGILGVLCCCWP